MARFGAVEIFCVALAILPSPARAATPPAAEAARPDPLQPAFEALAEAERRALQDALVWIGDSTGAVTGTFGPRTRDALLAHARRAGVPPSQALDAGQRALILDEAKMARREVGFAPLRDPRAGVAIGVPLKRLTVRSTLPSGTRFAAPGDGMVLETFARETGADGLAQIAERLARDTPGRRVTYRLTKPDFVVVASQDATRKTYTRAALGVGAKGASAVRGFAVSYPVAAADDDRIALAIAASFDPFPPDGPAVPTVPVPPPAAAPVPLALALAGQAVLVGPGLALTRAEASQCDGAEVGGAPARWLRQDPSSGLALLAVPGRDAVAPVALAAVAGSGPDRLALFLATGSDGRDALSVAGVSADAAGRVRAPLQGGTAGAVLVDGAGALAGLVAGRLEPGVTVGGVVAEARYEVAEAGPIAAFLKDASVQTVPGSAPATAGEIAARWRPVILPLRCRARPPAP